jgi:hypothetical protein
MRYRSILIAVVFVSIAILTAGCASVVQGTSQSINVATEPPGATCTLHRNGQVISSVSPTPADVRVEKSAYDIDVVCQKEGFQDGKAQLKADAEAMTLGNILIGGIIGVAVDAASGAINKYAPNVTVSLLPREPTSSEVQDATSAGKSGRATAQELRSRLIKLKDLFDRGLLTADEYDGKRKEILASF